MKIKKEAYFLHNIGEKAKAKVQWNLSSFYGIVKSSEMGQSTNETIYGDQKVNVAACCFGNWTVK